MDIEEMAAESSSTLPYSHSAVEQDGQRDVALLLPTLIGGGAERAILNLGAELAERDFQVDLVVLKMEGDYKNQIPTRVRIVDVGPRRVSHSVPSLVRYLKREKPKAMLSAHHYANVVAFIACRLSRVPIRGVVSIHGKLEGHKSQHASVYERFLPQLTRFTYRRADAIVTVSEGTRMEFARSLGLPAEKISVIKNPVISESILSKAELGCDHPWFVPTQPPVIVSAGRFVPEKNYSLLIEAFSLLRSRRPARLVILGEGPLREEYLSKAKELGVEEDVELPGFVQNPYPYYGQAAMFVLSSVSEALPTVLIEALACGTPVISTDCANGPREILENGKFGHLVAQGNAQAMASAMEEVLRGDRRIPPKEMLTRYDTKSSADKYIDLLFPDKDIR